MKIKYYTPEIEEFHVGFRFERISYNNRSHQIELENIKWLKKYVDSWRDRNLNELKVDLLHGRIRVKYLDREDIEELGWGNYKKSSDDWYDLTPEYTIQPFNLSYRYFRLSHGREDGRVRIVGYEYTGATTDDEELFVGSCKNYNELERIMKQIGIK